MNERLKQFLAAENITQSQFADRIDVVRASVSHVLSGRNNPSYDFIRAIMKNYPRLNIEWLMFGKGKMYKEDRTEIPYPAAVSEASLFDTEDQPDEEMPRMHTEKALAADEYVKTSVSEASVATSQAQRRAVKIIVLFDDGSYQEIPQTQPEG